VKLSRRRRHTAIPLQTRLALWGGLVLALTGTGLFVQSLNNCVAVEVREHPTYVNAPAIEIFDLPPSSQQRVMTELNGRYCTCGCMMQLASCRNNHTSCRTSLKMGRDVAARYR
jgi:hypothetical protein